MKEPGRPANPAADDWLSPWRFGVALAFLIFVAFPSVLLGWESFVVRDFGVFVYPLAFFQRECFWSGHLPFWDPYNCCGIPFLAQWNTMPLYPPALIYLLLPQTWGLCFFDLLHLWFAGMGMYCLAARWTGNRLAASLAGLLFSFNGFSLNLLMWPSHMAAFSWMPWVVFAAEAAWREGGRKLGLAVLAGALQMLAGAPETILLTWLLLGALCALDCARPARAAAAASLPSPWRMAGRLAVLAVLVALLCSVQLLPFLDLALHSQRHTGFADTRWSLPGRGWANFVVPLAFGSTWNQDLFFQYGQYWTSSYYLGLPALLLALAALRRGKPRKIWFLAGVAALAYFLALGSQTFLYRSLLQLCPPLTLMTYPVKFLALAVFSVPLLAAFALAQVRAEQLGPRHCLRRLWPGAALLALLVAAVLVWEWKAPLHNESFAAILANGAARIGFLAALGFLLLLLQRGQEARGKMLFSLLLLLAAWLDLWTHEPNQNPAVPALVYAPDVMRREQSFQPEPALGQSRLMVSPAAADLLDRAHIRDARVGYQLRRLGFFSNCNLLDHVPKVDGFFSLYPREFEFLKSALYASTNLDLPRLEDFMAVSQRSASSDYMKFDPRQGFLPLITAGQAPSFLDDTNALRRMGQPDFDPARQVLLTPESERRVGRTEATSARVLSQHWGRARIEAEVESAGPTLAVIAQTYYHCWRASVDGQAVPLLRANFAFQAVPVPAGKHRLLLVYQDRAFEIGLGLSALGLLGWAIGWLTRFRCL